MVLGDICKGVIFNPQGGCSPQLRTIEKRGGEGETEREREILSNLSHTIYSIILQTVLIYQSFYIQIHLYCIKNDYGLDKEEKEIADKEKKICESAKHYLH